MAEMKASAPTKVEIYYDVVSPYTWLGFKVIFLFTYIFQHSFQFMVTYYLH